MSPAIFNVYIDAVIEEWQSILTEHFIVGKESIDTLLFADDQVIFSNSEDGLQMATNKLLKIIILKYL